MKLLKIRVSSNGWEYCDVVTLTYKNDYITKSTDNERYRDSEENPAPNQIILDSEYVITFEEGFEICI